MIKISKSDLIIEKAKGISYNDFYYSVYNKHNLKCESLSIKLGDLEIATLIECNDGFWYLSKIYSKFSSKENAIRGILKRLNGRLKEKKF